MKEDKWMDCWCVNRREGEERKSKKELGKEEEEKKEMCNGGITDHTFAVKANWT